MEYMIDDKLDTITRFSGYPDIIGAKLTYFHNRGHRDIRLVYKHRLIKVYLTIDNTIVDENRLI